MSDEYDRLAEQLMQGGYLSNDIMRKCISKVIRRIMAEKNAEIEVLKKARVIAERKGELYWAALQKVVECVPNSAAHPANAHKSCQTCVNEINLNGKCDHCTRLNGYPEWEKSV